MAIVAFSGLRTIVAVRLQPSARGTSAVAGDALGRHDTDEVNLGYNLAVQRYGRAR